MLQQIELPPEIRLIMFVADALRSDPGVLIIRHNGASTTYVHRDETREFLFDFLVTLTGGERVAICVRPDRVADRFRPVIEQIGEVQRLVALLGPNLAIADRVVLLTERDMKLDGGQLSDVLRTKL